MLPQADRAERQFRPDRPDPREERRASNQLDERPALGQADRGGSPTSRCGSRYLKINESAADLTQRPRDRRERRTAIRTRSRPATRSRRLPVPSAGAMGARRSIWRRHCGRCWRCSRGGRIGADAVRAALTRRGAAGGWRCRGRRRRDRCSRSRPPPRRGRERTVHVTIHFSRFDAGVARRSRPARPCGSSSGTPTRSTTSSSSATRRCSGSTRRVRRPSHRARPGEMSVPAGEAAGHDVHVPRPARARVEFACHLPGQLRVRDARPDHDRRDLWLNRRP